MSAITEMLAVVLCLAPLFDNAYLVIPGRVDQKGDITLKKFARYQRRAIVAVIALATGFGALAQTVKKEIRIGNTAPYSGPASFYSMVGHATSAYFAKVNDEGGINGRKVQVISLDDALAPPKTVEQVRRLVEQDEVDLIVNQVGTATSSSVRKYLNVKKVPQIFVQSGSNNFQSPTEFKYSTSGLMNYGFEARIYAKYIVQHLPNARIGILFQNDDYGKDYVHGLKQGLGERASKMLVSEVTYQQTDPTIDSQVLELKSANVDTIVLAAYSKQVSQALRKMTDLGWKPQVFVSHVSAQVNPTLTNVGLTNVVGLLTAAVVKDPSDPAWQSGDDYKGYLAWMQKYYPGGDPLNSSNAAVYSSSAAIAHVLKSAGDDLSRDNILAKLTQLKDFKAPMLLPGISMTMSADNYNLFHKVQLMRFDGAHWVPQGPPIGE